MKIEKIDQIIFYCMCGIAFSSCISLGMSSIFMGLVTLTVLIRLSLKTNDLKVTGYGYIFKVMLFFLFTMLLSAIFSGDFIYALEKYLFHYAYRMLPMVLIAFFIKDIKKIMLLLTITVISLLFSDGHAIWQGLHGNFRASGFSGGPMWMGTFLAVMLPVMLLVMINRKIFNHYHKFYSAAFFISLIALLFNGTRGVWVGMVIILPFFSISCIDDWKKVIKYCAVSILIIGILCGSVPSIANKVESIASISNQSNVERLRMWKSALNMAIDHPLLGVGLGNYSEAYQKKYILPEAKERTQGHAHNDFMQMLGENGMIGLSGFSVMFGYFMIYSFKKWKRNKNIFALMALGATAGFLFHGLTEYNFGSAGSIKLYWLVFALCVQGSCILDLSKNERMISK